MSILSIFFWILALKASRSTTPVSGKIIWTVAKTLAIDLTGSSASLSVAAYPNPSQNSLTVELTDSLSSNYKKDGSLDEFYQLIILDKNSQKIYSRQSSEKATQITTDAFLPGVYYLIIQYKDAILKRQIIIEK